MLLAVDPDEYFVYIKDVTIPSVIPLQSLRIERAELDALETTRLSADSDASFSQKIFDIPVT